MASGIVQNNPVALIKFKRAGRQNREALSEAEIKAFLERIKDVKYDKIRQFAYILYFFGLRPCEIDEEAHREGEFLIVRNRKRKNGKIEYKKIPIPTQAQGLIDWDKPLTTNLHRLKVNDTMKELLNGKTAYYLRHTFATTCQQYVRPDIVDIWMGDSPTRLVGRVYTHFPDKFMRKNMDFIKQMTFFRARDRTTSTSNTFCLIVHDLVPFCLRFGVVTPNTTQRTPFEKYGCSDSRSVVSTKTLDV